VSGFELRKPNAGTRHKWQRLSLHEDVCLRCSLHRRWETIKGKLYQKFNGRVFDKTPPCGPNAAGA